MTPYAVEVDQRQLLTGLNRLEGLYDDLSPVFEDVGEAALDDIQKRFDAGGPGWPPHATSSRKKLIGPRRLLRDSDVLYNSFKRGGQGNIFNFNRTESEAGSSIFYGRFHQEGLGRNPERKMVDVTSEQEAQYIEIASELQMERIRSLGFEVS